MKATCRLWAEIHTKCRRAKVQQRLSRQRWLFDFLSRLNVYLPDSRDIHFTLRRAADSSYAELTCEKKFAEIPRKSNLPICSFDEILVIDQFGVPRDAGAGNRPGKIKKNSASSAVSYESGDISIKIDKDCAIEITKTRIASPFVLRKQRDSGRVGTP